MQGRAARGLPALALITIIFPLRMPKAHAEGMLNRFDLRDCCAKLRGSLFWFRGLTLRGLSREMKFAWTAKGSPLGRAGALAPERARLLPLRAIVFFCAFTLKTGYLAQRNSRFLSNSMYLRGKR